MTHTILTIDELNEARAVFDHLHEGVIDLQCDLESGNWGCPVNSTEEIRKNLAVIVSLGFKVLKCLDYYIEWQDKLDKEGWPPE